MQSLHFALHAPTGDIDEKCKMASISLGMSRKARHSGRELNRASVCKIHDLPGSLRVLVRFVVSKRASSRSKTCVGGLTTPHE